MAVRLFLFLLFASMAPAQPVGALRGTVADRSGAVLPGASVRVVLAEKTYSTVAATDGTYSLSGLPPGEYAIRVSFPAMSAYDGSVEIASGKTTACDVQLAVGQGRTVVTVKSDAGPRVSTDAQNNASALVLRGADLDALADDPDSLAADLQALAGPGDGPNGGQVFIDGFSGGRLPPKESIREVRVNQNPFSAEFDKFGMGRVEVLTKPGADRLRGQLSFSYSNAVMDARNPFLATRPDYSNRLFGASLAGPLGPRVSLSLDAERREVDDSAVIGATVLDPVSLAATPYHAASPNPSRRTTFSPRLDARLSPNHNLTGRYNYTRIGRDSTGTGDFMLESRAYAEGDTAHTLQLTETGVLSQRTVNETRLQMFRTRATQTGDNLVPALNVLDSFVGGGAQTGNAYIQRSAWEVHNITSHVAGRHALRFGLRMRTAGLSDNSPTNFGGTFTFSGGAGVMLDNAFKPILDAAGQPRMVNLTSLERYRRTLFFGRQGLSAAQIRALGGGAAQFSIVTGNSLSEVRQTDIGIFFQDEWRIRPNLTLTAGLRYETQTNISDRSDFAPRLGLAWAPGGQTGKTGKTVFRIGSGVFYDRFPDTLVLQSLRFNGVAERQYMINNPEFYPSFPPVNELKAQSRPQTVRQIQGGLRTPQLLEGAVSVERQLPWHTTVSSTLNVAHGTHLLRMRNINAPVAGTAMRPYGGDGNIYEYESGGLLNQRQWIVNVNGRPSVNTSFFSYYSLVHSRANTDTVSTMPANPYDLSGEYGRTSYDVHNRFLLGGSAETPGQVRFSPYIYLHSGGAYNITSGRDLNGDSLFTERPALVNDAARAGVIATPYGLLDPNPAPGAAMIPRNFGNTPSYFTVNMRVSRTFAFGPALASNGQRTERRFHLMAAISARNLFNHVNLAAPVGNLTSPLFGKSTQTVGTLGPGAASMNRHVDALLRLTF